MRAMQSEIRRVAGMAEDELFEAAKQLGVPYALLKEVHDNGKLPVVNFAAGGVATPASSAPRACSWAPAFSRAATPQSALPPS